MSEAGKVLISIIMAAHNSEAFIEDAIYSILQQTHSNLELIIIEDASTDATGAKVLAISDPRIKYIKNKEKKGPGLSRNIGLAEAKGEFIAIMDSDDIALPDRLASQLNFLTEHTAIDLIGAGINEFCLQKPKKVFFPASPEYIKSWLLFNNCMHNPTTFFRRKLLDAGDFSYNNFFYGEDHFLWYSLVNQGYKISNLNKIVLNYRRHENQLTQQFLNEREDIIYKRFAERLIDKLDIHIPADQYNIITRFIHTRLEVGTTEFNVLKHFLKRLYMENVKTGTYKTTYFNAVLWFFFLRLGKYYYLEKGKPLRFLKHFSEALYMLGLKSFYIFLKNNKGYR